MPASEISIRLETPDELIASYARGPEELRDALAGLTPDQLRTRPIAGKWSIMEVLCHLSDCDQFNADRMKRTLAMDKPLLLGADGFRYPQPVKYHQRDVEEELALIEMTRRQMARILRLVEPDAWIRQAVHSELGLLTLRQLLLRTITHQTHHLAFIHEKRKAMGIGRNNEHHCL